MLTADVWAALVIATFGTAIVLYYGWTTRYEVKQMKYLLYSLIGMMTFLWVSVLLMVVFNVV